MKVYDRRKFIMKMGLCSLGIPLLGYMGHSFGLHLPSAEGKANRFFVRIKLNGGWDTSLCFDPWIGETRPAESDMYIEYLPSDIKKCHQIYLGPSAHSLSKFTQDMAVINGIVVGQFDLGHPSAISYMDTASPKGLNPSFTAQLAANSTAGPYGVIVNDPLVMGNLEVDTNRISDLLNSRKDAFIYPHLSRLIEFGTSSELVKAQKSLVTTKDMTKKTFEYLRRLEKSSQEISDFQVIASCFQASASFHADITWFKGLDTHTGHVGRHRAELKGLIDDISTGIEYFQSVPYGEGGQSLYDHTTFLITSEFSRTPWLNASGGRDHNTLCNSVVLIGKGIQGGITIGKSKLVKRETSPYGFSYQIGHPINYSQGRIQSDGDFIRPENIFKSIAKIMRGDAAYFEDKYPQHLVIPGLIKDNYS